MTSKDDISDYMAKIGAKGGQSGTGESKKRSPAHYKKMAAARKKKRLARARLCIDNASG